MQLTASLNQGKASRVLMRSEGIADESAIYDLEGELWSTADNGLKIGIQDASFKTHFHVDDPDHSADTHIKDLTVLLDFNTDERYAALRSVGNY